MDSFGQDTTGSGGCSQEATPATNASEDAVAWAMAHFDAERGIVDGLSRESRDGISARLDRLHEDEAPRLLEVDGWRERDRVADRLESRVAVDEWRRCQSYDARWDRRVNRLLSVGPTSRRGLGVRAQLAVLKVALEEDVSLDWPVEDRQPGPLRVRYLIELQDRWSATMTALGVWQIAGMLACRSVRDAARARSKMPASWRSVFDTALDRNDGLPRAATTRLQEVYLSLRRRPLDFGERTERLALFALACAAGGRFERRLEACLRALPASRARRARGLAGLNSRALRRRLGPAFRLSLTHFWDMWDEDSSGGDGSP